MSFQRVGFCLFYFQQWYTFCLLSKTINCMLYNTLLLFFLNNIQSSVNGPLELLKVTSYLNTTLCYVQTILSLLTM